MKKPDAPLRPLTSPAAAGPTPAQSEEFARTNNRLTVRDYLPRVAHDGSAVAGKCEWSSHVAVSLTPEEAGALAWVLIDTIMRARFGPATQLHDTWRHHTLAGTKILIRSVLDRKAQHVETGAGRRGNPADWAGHRSGRGARGDEIQL